MISLMNQLFCSADQIPYTIRIGVTGHRFLHDEEALNAAVYKCLDEYVLALFDKKTQNILAGLSHTQICFSVVTPLAEGADRIVAREVLRFPNTTIEAVLPLTKEDYLQDFEDDKSVNEFQQLLALSNRPVFLRTQHINDQFQEEERAFARKQAYDNAGRYTVDNCDVLIALWNNMPGKGMGGTADIIEYAKSVHCPVIIISIEDPFAIEVFSGRGIKGEVVACLETFNSYNIPEREKQKYIDNVFHDLFATEFAQPLHDEAKQLVKESLIPVYVRASCIAKYHQTIYRNSGIITYVFSAVAVAAVALGVLIHSLAFPAYLTELVLLLGIISIVFYAERKASHRLWYENRIFSERLRSAFFFTACGLQPERIKMPIYMQQAWQQNWMLSGYESICGRLPAAKDTLISKCACATFIREKWLKDQLEYHSVKAEVLHKKNHRLEMVAFFFFGIAIVSASLHLLIPFIHAPWIHSIESIVTYFAISMPAFGAAVGGIRAHRDYGRLTMQSKNQADALRVIEQRFAQCQNIDELQGFLHEIDEAMLEESRDWLNLVRFLKIEAAA